MLAAVDEGVGQICEALRKTGQLDNTLFVFTSDHGYFYGEHGLSVERRLAYEESIRIPAVDPLSGPDPARQLPMQMVLNIDVAPTLLELAGTGRRRSLHGRSLLPLLRGEALRWRSSLLVEYYSDKVFPRIQNMGYTAVRDQRYKYIRYNELRGMDELYDLQADPYEMKNLVAEPARQPALLEMQAELEKLKQQAR